eukprot:NODE_4923_length_743_cov_35.845821_g4567_i0.p1 GENE.NODE_4923_length_743_cov_35.845821_g4567_i0~~NODE_4923_length_743_cov_35.845821_g4567_i0.p1  ORF type:complete len:161 (+),score=22.38 NODE_4923_length_743_cov_35.845821_g4567_i0:142-624(+)
MASKGICKRWIASKAFGYISPDDGGEDIFAHQSELFCVGFRSMAVGEEVEYYTETENGKVKAVKVTGPGGQPLKGCGGPGGPGGKYFDKDGNPVFCDNCKEDGHFARDCPQGKGECFACGETGHYSRECPINPTSRACYSCGEDGHRQRDCPYLERNKPF